MDASVQYHIRKRGQGHDRRTRACAGFNKLSPTICGAEPTTDDTDKKSARAGLSIERFYKPGSLTHTWLSRMCPACRKLIESKDAP